MYLERFQKESADVPGFVAPESIAIWDFLLAEQHDKHVSGALLEIGVYYGKSAIMLAMHARPEEELVLIDCADFVDQAAVLVQRFKPDNLQIIKEESSSQTCWALTQNRKNAFRWIHVDGDHKAKTVENDLHLASQLLADDGVLCVDDFFNPRYPHLTFAVNEFLLAKQSEFKMFLCGFNKAYIARTGHHQKLVQSVHFRLARGLTERGFSNFTIYKTDYPGICNAFGIGSRWQHYVRYGLDEDPNRIIHREPFRHESSFPHLLLLHCHIPKTAGTTVSAGLRKSFEILHFHHFHPDPFYILDRENLEQLLEIDPSLRSISSHHLRSFPLSVCNRPTFLITFLRRPEDTFISQLKYAQRHFSTFPPEVQSLWPKETPRLSLRELARAYLDMVTANQDFSPQTRFFCNPDAMARFGLSDGNRYGLDSWELAYAILKEFHFVGIVDEMKKSLELLTDLLGQRGVKVYFSSVDKENSSPERAQPAWLTLEDEVGRRVLEASKSDSLLYRHFREELLSAHAKLRQRRWLGFGPAYVDAREAFRERRWSGLSRSLANSARLLRQSQELQPSPPCISAPEISYDLLEERAAKAFTKKTA